ncbi:MAG: peptidoglycan DD-metalloendopeptidase family protein [Alphaproteobacteria bacterium]|nr:peptidoglycan DD-metalloendopeptidase family protein [Alphaproteobacteria bacterium]
MFNWLAKYYSSLMSLLTAPFRAVWRLICRLLPERDFTIISGGDLVSYHQTSFWRFVKAVGTFALILWAAWSTYVFVYHRPLLQKRTRQLEEARTQHAQQMSDLSVFYKRYSELHKEMNSIDDQLINDKKLKKDAQEALLKRRVNTWAQIEMLGTRVGNMMLDADYTPEIVKLSELSVEWELTREENRQLREANKALEKSMVTVSDASVQIYERVSKLTKENLDSVNKNMGKIRGTLSNLGLSDRALAQQALVINNHIIGSAIPPLELDKDIDQKYKDLAEKVELWQGLSRALSMLPLGAPVKNPTITSKYGEREHPLEGKTLPHKGIDFAGAAGTPLLAVAPGKVIFVGEKNGYGRTVEVDHGLGFTTLYAHLSKFNVQRGDVIRAKDIVGFSGNSGRSTSSHLHYEIRYNDNPFNPYSFVKGDK